MASEHARTRFILRQDGARGIGATDDLTARPRDRDRRLLELGELLAQARLELFAARRELERLRTEHAAALGTIAITRDLLRASLECGVPLAIARLRTQGGPSAAERHGARAFARVLGERGDQLLYGGPACRQVWGGLVRALAVLAYQPGGVRFGELHWEVAADGC